MSLSRIVAIVSSGTGQHDERGEKSCPQFEFTQSSLP
jgi:hypothetical protein